MGADRQDSLFFRGVKKSFSLHQFYHMPAEKETVFPPNWTVCRFFREFNQNLYRHFGKCDEEKGAFSEHPLFLERMDVPYSDYEDFEKQISDLPDWIKRIDKSSFTAPKTASLCPRGQ